MAARKTPKKAAKKAPARKATAASKSKTGAKATAGGKSKTGPKPTAGGKSKTGPKPTAGGKSKTGPKPGAGGKSKTGPKPGAGGKSKTDPKPGAGGKSKTGAKPGAAPKKQDPKFSAVAVNRSHLFALRPRVSTAFRPEDFLAAKRQLEDERYESIEAAARAVAERALALCNEPTKRRDFQPGR
jgi:hypothetical protein